jgi:hypothetical protein
MIPAVQGSRRHRFRWFAAACAFGALALTPAGSSASGSPCADGQALGPCAVGVIGGLLGQGQCQTPAPSPDSGTHAPTSAQRLQSLIEQVPCPQTGRVSYGTADNLGNTMSVLDPVSAPGGGYLGVYHTPYRDTPGGVENDFRINLATSTDLIHWTWVTMLDSAGASMPTLRSIPGAPGYLLAYEKRLPGRGSFVRLRYYRTLQDLLAGRYAAQRELPRCFSQYNNGTPTILWTRWNHSLSRSVIELGFHYQTVVKKWRPGPDREALGTLRGFRRWSARLDPATDSALQGIGLSGSHGDWRQFSFEGGRWRLYEGQTAYNDFGTWRVVLEDATTHRVYQLALRMGSDAVSNSFANPVARLETAPGGHGNVLVVTMFLFSSQLPGGTGELVYYEPA